MYMDCCLLFQIKQQQQQQHNNNNNKNKKETFICTIKTEAEMKNTKKIKKNKKK